MSCTFHNDYYDPSLHGACTAELVVPAGCPVHVVTPAGDAPELVVTRGMQPVTLPSTVSLVETVTVPMDRVNPFDCACAFTPGAFTYDRHVVMVDGTVEGDVVSFDAGKVNGSTWVTFDAPGPCPAALWPTDVIVATRCDRCPDTPESDDGGGCSAAGGSPIVVALVAALVAQRSLSRMSP